MRSLMKRRSHIRTGSRRRRPAAAANCARSSVSPCDGQHFPTTIHNRGQHANVALSKQLRTSWRCGEASAHPHCSTHSLSPPPSALRSSVGVPSSAGEGKPSQRQ